jgi:hypothetical protein
VGKGSKPPIRVERLDTQSGRRVLLRELSPPDPAGVSFAQVLQWIEDGRGYIYWYYRQNSTLYVVSGVEGR